MNSDDAVPGSFAKVFNTFVERDGDGWCVSARVDGQRKVVSRHATLEQANRADYNLNESANRPSPKHDAEDVPASG